MNEPPRTRTSERSERNRGRYRALTVSPDLSVTSHSVVHELAGAELVDLEGVFGGVHCVGIIEDVVNGSVQWEASLFLRHVAIRSRSVTGDTIRTYAAGLAVWLNFLEHGNVPLCDATEEDLQLFGSELLRGQPRKSASTTRLYMAAAASFHEWGAKTGSARSPLGDYLRARKAALHRGERHFSRSLARMDNLYPSQMQRMPRVLSLEELRKLMGVTAQPYRLMFRWAAITGMRRFEICSLNRSHIESARSVGLPGEGMSSIDLLRKGSRELSVYLPTALLEETEWYWLAERSKPAFNGEGAVFLNLRGRRVSRGSLSQEFRRRADEVGSTATLHHLRHTFAVNVLKILDGSSTKEGPLNSIKTVQVLLGHASIETTEIYLQAMSVISEEVRSALKFLYEGIQDD